jgi:2-isopropylmalate synthase
VTLALNMYTQGVDPQLDFSNINAIARCAEECTRLPIHPRHPYVGDLVFTAFSGSHQDAIKKGLAALPPGGVWDVPYLPIDPVDLGRSYESIIRVNSQSGKGGVAFLLERDYQLVLPRRLQIEFSRVVQGAADASGKELTAADLWQLFEAEYLAAQAPFAYLSHQLITSGDGHDRERISLHLLEEGQEITLQASGTGPIDACVRALGLPIDVVAYDEHSCATGSDAKAVAYVELSAPRTPSLFGVGAHANIITASLLAVLSAVNRAIRRGVLHRAEARTGT